MKTVAVFIGLLLHVSCADNHAKPSSDRSDELQPHQLSDSLISFKKMNADRFWSWLIPAAPPDESIKRFMFESDPNNTEALIEQLHKAEQKLDQGDESLAEMDRLEFQFFTHMYLSTLYRRKADQTNPDAQLPGIIRHKKTALSYMDQLIEKDNAYKVDRAFPELELLMLRCRKNTDRECFDGLHQMLNRYDKTPYGQYPEFFSTNFILPGMTHYFSNPEDKKLHQDYLHVLEKLAGRADLLGVSAKLHLAQNYLRNRDLEKARLLLEDISAERKQMEGSEDDLPNDLQRLFNRMDSLYQRLYEQETGESLY